MDGPEWHLAKRARADAAPQTQNNHVSNPRLQQHPAAYLAAQKPDPKTSQLESLVDYDPFESLDNSQQIDPSVPGQLPDSHAFLNAGYGPVQNLQIAAGLYTCQQPIQQQQPLPQLPYSQEAPAQPEANNGSYGFMQHQLPAQHAASSFGVPWQPSLYHTGTGSAHFPPEQSGHQITQQVVRGLGYQQALSSHTYPSHPSQAPWQAASQFSSGQRTELRSPSSQPSLDATQPAIRERGSDMQTQRNAAPIGSGAETGPSASKEDRKQAALSPLEHAPATAIPPAGPVKEQAAERVQSQVGASSTGRSEGEKRVVWVWDLDETLIIFHSLLTNQFLEPELAKTPALSEGRALGERWEHLILDICDKYMFFDQVETQDQANMLQILSHDDGASLESYDFNADKAFLSAIGPLQLRRLAYRYRVIRDFYLKGLGGVLDEQKRAEWEELYAATDSFTGGWLSAGRSLLQGCAEAGGLNVVVSSGQLIPTLAKCLLFKLDIWIHPDNVYSSRSASKYVCFRWVKERFQESSGPVAEFCAVGDGAEEKAASKRMNWPFVEVALHADKGLQLPSLTLETLHEVARSTPRR